MKAQHEWYDERTYRGGRETSREQRLDSNQYVNNNLHVKLYNNAQIKEP